jgi:hypothetical protein
VGLVELGEIVVRSVDVAGHVEQGALIASRFFMVSPMQLTVGPRLPRESFCPHHPIGVI